MHGRLEQLDAGVSGALWGVNKQYIFKSSDGGNNWINVAGRLKYVSAGGGGVWGVNIYESIYYYTGKKIW